MKGKKVSPQRAKEIELEKSKLREELREQTVDDVISSSENQGERYFLKKFNSAFVGVRKSLVLLKKQRALGIKTAEDVYQETQELFRKFLDE